MDEHSEIPFARKNNGVHEFCFCAFTCKDLLIQMDPSHFSNILNAASVNLILSQPQKN